MNVINKYNILALLLTVVLLVGCNTGDSYKVNLDQIEALDVPINEKTHAFRMRIEGKITCDAELIFLKEGQEFKRLMLNGEIDKDIRQEWYSQKISFKIVNDDNCDLSNVHVNFKLLTI